MFTRLTRQMLANLPQGYPIFYRGDGSKSLEHIVLDGGTALITRTIHLTASDAEDWKFDMAAVTPGARLNNPTSGARYEVTAVYEKDGVPKLVAFFVGTLSDDRIGQFSLDPA